MKVIVIGGGAAGFFGAITCARYNYNAEIILLEKSDKLLSKVKVSGGGRCNITHACFDNNQLIKFYPRGGKELKTCFTYFSTNQTVDWFESRGVKLKTEADNRMFPVSDSSQSVVDCLIREARVLGVKIMTSFPVGGIERKNGQWYVKLRGGENMVCDKILVATGGSPSDDSYNWMRELGLEVVKPVPSLFTFNIPNSRLSGLQGVSVPHVEVRVEGTKLSHTGPLLITHWGFSGPAVLKLSAWAAREIHDMNYNFNIHINFVPEHTEESLREKLHEIKMEHSKKIVSSNPFFEIPKRLWERLTNIAGIEEEVRWMEVPNKSINKLLEELLRGNYSVKGKTTFKEEFVTCGGVDLKEVDIVTMQSKKQPGLYFAGEVLNIDAVTGGFNFQAAWTTGFLAGKSIAED
ncbi:MAG TPA: NAD(P)/FAD-dependent oxidoreductase [Cytophagaceae bacterium]|jgi:predicted Rossmann fold flavoprotein|nr:NAD(P)/FAD-dependent oxidoreductase [Cytophagaceae bacterium]